MKEIDFISGWMQLKPKVRNRGLKKWAKLSKSPVDAMRAACNGTLFADLPEPKYQKSDFEWTRNEDIRPFDYEKWAARFK